MTCVGGDWIIGELSLRSIEVKSKAQNLTSGVSEVNDVKIEEIEVEERQKRKCSKSGWRDKDFLFQIEYMGQWNCSQKNLLDYENDNEVDIQCKFSNDRSPTVSQEIIIQFINRRFITSVSGLFPVGCFKNNLSGFVVL